MEGNPGGGWAGAPGGGKVGRITRQRVGPWRNPRLQDSISRPMTRHGVTLGVRPGIVSARMSVAGCLAGVFASAGLSSVCGPTLADSPVAGDASQPLLGRGRQVNRPEDGASSSLGNAGRSRLRLSAACG